MITKLDSALAVAEELGARLKQARLNSNLTQVEIAEITGLSRKKIINIEQGNAVLLDFVAVMQALNLTDHLNLFLPIQDVSPVQLSRLQGKKPKRASRQKKILINKEEREW